MGEIPPSPRQLHAFTVKSRQLFLHSSPSQMFAEFLIMPLHSIFRSLIKKAFHKQDFFTIREVFHQQRFCLDQGIFLQKKIFRQSREFSVSKDFSLIREFFHKQRFYIHIILKILGKKISTFLVLTKGHTHLHKKRDCNCRLI